MGPTASSSRLGWKLRGLYQGVSIKHSADDIITHTSRVTNSTIPVDQGQSTRVLLVPRAKHIALRHEPSREL